MKTSHTKLLLRTSPILYNNSAEGRDSWGLIGSRDTHTHWCNHTQAETAPNPLSFIMKEVKMGREEMKKKTS